MGTVCPSVERAPCGAQGEAARATCTLDEPYRADQELGAWWGDVTRTARELTAEAKAEEERLLSPSPAVLRDGAHLAERYSELFDARAAILAKLVVAPIRAVLAGAPYKWVRQGLAGLIHQELDRTEAGPGAQSEQAHPEGDASAEPIKGEVNGRGECA